MDSVRYEVSGQSLQYNWLHRWRSKLLTTRSVFNYQPITTKLASFAAHEWRESQIWIFRKIPL